MIRRGHKSKVEAPTNFYTGNSVHNAKRGPLPLSTHRLKGGGDDQLQVAPNSTRQKQDRWPREWWVYCLQKVLKGENLCIYLTDSYWMWPLYEALCQVKCIPKKWKTIINALGYLAQNVCRRRRQAQTQVQSCRSYTHMIRSGLGEGRSDLYKEDPRAEGLEQHWGWALQDESEVTKVHNSTWSTTA